MNTTVGLATASISSWRYHDRSRVQPIPSTSPRCAPRAGCPIRRSGTADVGLNSTHRGGRDVSAGGETGEKAAWVGPKDRGDPPAWAPEQRRQQARRRREGLDGGLSKMFPAEMAETRKKVRKEVERSIKAAKFLVAAQVCFVLAIVLVKQCSTISPRGSRPSGRSSPSPSSLRSAARKSDAKSWREFMGSWRELFSSGYLVFLGILVSLGQMLLVLGLERVSVGNTVVLGQLVPVYMLPARRVPRRGEPERGEVHRYRRRGDWRGGMDVADVARWGTCSSWDVPRSSPRTSPSGPGVASVSPGDGCGDVSNRRRRNHGDRRGNTTRADGWGRGRGDGRDAGHAGRGVDHGDRGRRALRSWVHPDCQS